MEQVLDLTSSQSRTRMRAKADHVIRKHIHHASIGNYVALIVSSSTVAVWTESPNGMIGREEDVAEGPSPSAGSQL